MVAGAVTDCEPVRGSIVAARQRSGERSPFEPAPDIRAAAESIVAKLRAKGFRADAATVDLDTLEHENPRSAGCERLCLKALDDLRLRRHPLSARDNAFARLQERLVSRSFAASAKAFLKWGRGMLRLSAALIKENDALRQALRERDAAVEGEIASLRERVAALERSATLDSTTSSKPLASDGLNKEQRNSAAHAEPAPAVHEAQRRPAGPQGNHPEAGREPGPRLGS